MDQILDAPLSDQRNVDYAGFWIRAAAYIIDIITIWLIIMILIFAVGTGIIFAGENTFLPIVFFLILFISVISYFSFMESSSWQATLGKRAVGIKVGDVNGNRISFANALGRFFAKYLSGFFFGIGYMMAGWDKKKQALHDRLANTYVYYG